MNTLRLRIPLFSLLAIFILACQPEQKKVTGNNMVVTGSVEGLRKGTLYLQKIEDTKLVNIDSTLVNGTPNFEFKTPLETPEVFYLYLDKEDGDSLNDRILFFGEKGTIEINTLLKTFESSAEIIGSKNQELLQEHIAFKRKFNDQNLEGLDSVFIGINEIQKAVELSAKNAMESRKASELIIETISHIGEGVEELAVMADELQQG